MILSRVINPEALVSLLKHAQDLAVRFRRTQNLKYNFQNQALTSVRPPHPWGGTPLLPYMCVCAPRAPLKNVSKGRY